jgi:Transposase, Mutator family
VVHFYCNVFSHEPNGKVAEVARMLKAIDAQEDRRAAKTKATEIVERFKAMKLRTAAELVEQKVSEWWSTWRQIRSNNPLERIIREIRRRTRVVGAFPDGHSALMLSAARPRHIASTKWGKQRYMLMEPLLNPAEAGGSSLEPGPNPPTRNRNCERSVAVSHRRVRGCLAPRRPACKAGWPGGSTYHCVP